MDTQKIPPDDHLRGGVQSVWVHGRRGGQVFDAQDWLAEEVPVALEYNGISQAVMLATPLDLEDFAIGFSLSEGLIDAPQEVFDIEESVSGLGITLKMRVAGACFARLKDRRRQLAGRTGCGLCGIDSLAQLASPARTPALQPAYQGEPLAADAITQGLSQLAERQSLQELTGAVHAAAWCSDEGELLALREDVGRHNALDKLIGALARADTPPTTGFIAITSRASFEMVQKAVLAGAPLLVAVSAPTALAVRSAEQAGLTLAGWAREGDLVLYSHGHRVILE